jgi:phosphatidylglycerophosphatase A
MERYPGGWCVMADDILSGVYGLIAMSTVQIFL